MQGSKRRQRRDGLDRFVVEQRRRGESCAAMNDPVSNRIDRVQVKPLQRVRYALQRVAGTGERRRAAFVRLAVPEAVFAASVLEAFVGTLEHLACVITCTEDAELQARAPRV